MIQPAFDTLTSKSIFYLTGLLLYRQGITIKKKTVLANLLIVIFAEIEANYLSHQRWWLNLFFNQDGNKITLFQPA